MTSTNIITTRGVIGLLFNQVGVCEAQGLAEQCVQIGMMPTESQARDMAMATHSTNLPPFDIRYHLLFRLDSVHESLFEILGKEGLILQAGYQLILPTRLLFPSKAKKLYSDAIQVLESHYGTGAPMAVQGTEIMNYGNVDTIAYASLAKMGRTESVTQARWPSPWLVPVRCLHCAIPHP